MSKVASIRPNDLLSLAWSSLRRNRLRSSLTIGAVGIGIGIMFYLISLGYGLEGLTIDSVSKSSALLSLTVNSANEEILPLNKKTLTTISAIPHTGEPLPQATLEGLVTLENSNTPATIIAAAPGYLQINDASRLVAGSYYRADDEQAMVVTTGLLKIFGLDGNKNPLVTFKVTIGGDKITGIPPITDVAVTGVVDDSTSIAIYLPINYVERLVGDQMPHYSSVKVTVDSLQNVHLVAEAIRNNGYRVTAVTDTVDQIEQVFKWVRIILSVLGLIAIGVASIGMFNTLTISLLERTREIGIMKALGVRKGDVQRLFMVEAMLMGLIGGLVGIGLGLLFQQLTIFVFSLLAAVAQGVVPQLFINKPWIIMSFLLFGLAIAVITGVYPARRAMRLNAIDAIRYE